jgi:hypothetical protein
LKQTGRDGAKTPQADKFLRALENTMHDLLHFDTDKSHVAQLQKL